MPEFVKLPEVATKPLSLVLLAHNAEAHVVSLVRGWRDVLQARATTFEIILVDDSSGDRTVARAEELLSSMPELKVLRQESPRGIGAALRTGLAATSCPLIACALCDPAYRPQDLALFLKDIDKLHVQTGYRAGRPVPGPLRVAGWVLRLLCKIAFTEAPRPLPGWPGWRGYLGGLLARFFFGVPVRDPTCPYRVFRRELLARSPLQSDGDFAWVEQVAKFNFAACYFGPEEVPLPIVPPSGRPSGLFREAYRVFKRPSFGPPVLPEIPAV